MYHLVYLTTNTINGKYYVGVHSTYDLNDGYLGSGNGFKRALKKYGKESFKRDILYYCLTEYDMFDIEGQIVNAVFIKRKDTYNQVTGGQYSSLGRVYSEESKQKMSITASTRKRTPHSEETKKKMSLIQQNLSEEKRLQRSEKLSKINKGKKLSSERCEFLSKLHKGKTISQEHRRSISEKLKGHIVSEETSKQISDRQRKTYILLNEVTGETIIIDNISQWIVDNNFSTCMLYKSFRENTSYKGYRLISKSGGTHWV